MVPVITLFLGSLGVAIDCTVTMKSQKHTYGTYHTTVLVGPHHEHEPTLYRVMKRRRQKGRIGICAGQNALDPKTYIAWIRPILVGDRIHWKGFGN